MCAGFSASGGACSAIRTRIESLDQAGVAINAHQQHRTVAADAPDIGHVVVGRADPGSSRGDHGSASGGFVHGRFRGVANSEGQSASPWPADATLAHMTCEDQSPLEGG